MSWKTYTPTCGEHLLINIPGHALKLTRASCGSQPIPDDEIKEATALPAHAMDLSITDYSPDYDKDNAKLRVQLDNEKVASSFNMYNIAIWAQLFEAGDETKPVSDEVILHIIQDGEHPDHIRTNPQITGYLVNVALGEAETVIVNIDHAARVTVGMFRDLRNSFEEHNTDPESHPDLREELSNKAEKGTPELYELEPLNGFYFPEGGSNFYCKTQENIVVLSANISKDVNESIGNQEVIGQLPYGFCPATLVQAAGMLYNPRISPPILPGIVAINEKGEKTVVHHTQDSYYRVHFSCTFPAEY